MCDDFITKSGMRVSDLMLLEYCTYGNYPSPPSGYPRFWEIRYGINDVDSALSSLELHGYIRLKTAREMLSSLPVAQLKLLASLVGASSKGKKADLIGTLSNISDTELEHAIPFRKYCLTEKGETIRRDNEHIIFAAQNSEIGVSPKRMDELVIENPERPFRDLIWMELNSRIPSYASRGA